MNNIYWICSKCGKSVPLREGNPTPPPPEGCNDSSGSGGLPPGQFQHDWKLEGAETIAKVGEPNWHCLRCNKRIPKADVPPGRRPKESGCNNDPKSGGVPEGKFIHVWEPPDDGEFMSGTEHLTEHVSGSEKESTGAKAERKRTDDEPNWHCLKCNKRVPKSDLPPGRRPKEFGCNNDPTSGGMPEGNDLHMWEPPDDGPWISDTEHMSGSQEESTGAKPERERTDDDDEPNWRCRKCHKKVYLSELPPGEMPDEDGCNNIPRSGGNPPGPFKHEWEYRPDDTEAQLGEQEGLVVGKVHSLDKPDDEPNWHCIKCGQKKPGTSKCSGGGAHEWIFG